MPRKIELTKTPYKYLCNLDRPTQKRIADKLKQIGDDPTDSRHSKPLEGSNRRSARVGKYRILFTYSETTITVADIGPRGQVYRKLK